MSKPFLKPRPKWDDLQTAYLLWKITQNVMVTDQECWEWQGSRIGKGYGRIGHSKKEELIHRLVYRLCVGPVKHSMKVCHECDNPPCCNPSHLFVGTQGDNLKDASQKGRLTNPSPKGGKRTSKLTAEQVREARKRADKGGVGIVTRLAKEYGVSVVLMSQVLRRIRYAWVD